MKAITIKQPFASLIAAGLKEYEFRNTYPIGIRLDFDLYQPFYVSEDFSITLKH